MQIFKYFIALLIINPIILFAMKDAGDHPSVIICQYHNFDNFLAISTDSKILITRTKNTLSFDYKNKTFIPVEASYDFWHAETGLSATYSHDIISEIKKSSIKPIITEETTLIDNINNHKAHIKNNKLVISDISSTQVLIEFQSATTLYAPTFSPNGKMFYAIRGNKVLHWDIPQSN
jgi:hypothetical protein